MVPVVAVVFAGEAPGRPGEEEPQNPQEEEAERAPPRGGMRAAQERGQECLPPKKRELPAAASSTAVAGHEDPCRAAEKGSGAGGGEASAEWGRGPGALAGGQSQTPSPYSQAGGGPEAVASVTVDQYGLLYKVAMPAATFSPPVVNVGTLPSAFGMASQLIQHPGIPFSPIHYAQLPPAPLQFVGSPYSLPYAVPPGFVPGHLLPSSAGLPTSHISHFVPYTPLLAEDSTPTPQAAHGFGKAAAPVSPPAPPQTHVGGQPLDASQGRIPVYYQVSRLPAGYSAFDAPVAGLNPEPVLQENHLDPKIATENGVQRMAAGAKQSEAKERWPRMTVPCGTNGPVLMSSQMVGRAEASGASQRSSPDTDLEVQRVVGVLSFQDYPGGSSPQEKGGSSPLNLSHRAHAPLQKGEMPRNPTEAVQAVADRSPSWRPPEQEQLQHRQLLKGLAVANGRSVPGSFQHTSHDSLGALSPEAAGTAQEVDCATRSQNHLPSHFMKGAIIQLATGELKRVEDLQTQDFVRSAEVSGGLKIDSSTVVDIQESSWQGLVTLHFVVGEQQSKVSIDVPPEHPFFVYGQGWSSCSPERTTRLFSLPCHALQVGDVCISISLQSPNGRLAPPASPPAPGQERPGTGQQGVLEPSVSAGDKSPLGKGGTVLGSPPEISWRNPISAHSWAGPSFQRLGEESAGPPLLRPSFIPQEVKLSIEGRSNAGK